jgi:hypothetical protein
MKNKNLVKVISISLALFSIGICLFIWGQVSGLEKGYFYGVFQSPPYTGIIAHGPNFFQSINIWYFIIAVGFCVYIVGKFLKSWTASNSVCILSLCAGIYPYWDMFSYKKEVLAMKTKFSYEYWLNNSIYFDWFLLFAAIILMIVQVNLIMTRKVHIETFKIN